VRRKIQLKYPDLVECGVFIAPKYPQYAASPDGISKEFVFEIKCPAKKGNSKKLFMQ
jgi:hypothetical protein